MGRSPQQFLSNHKPSTGTRGKPHSAKPVLQAVCGSAETDGAPLVVSDPREVVIAQSYVPALEAAAEDNDEYHRILQDLRANRNRPGGFWLAKDDPQAAGEAITGSCPISELNSAVLLSNGASRIVDRFHLTDWPGLLALLASTGKRFSPRIGARRPG